MVIVELIGSISLAIAFVGAVAFAFVQIKNKQYDITYIRDHTSNSIGQTDVITNCLQDDINQISADLPFEEIKQDIPITSPSKIILNKEVPVINVIDNDEISSTTIKYGIQWVLPSDEDGQPEITNILNPPEYEQGDSLSLSDQTTSVRNLIEKFETNSIHKIYLKEKNNQIDSDVTSIDTNFDTQTIKIDLNVNQKNFSYHSSISNLDVTIPSNLSSSIDLEQFDCFSATSNLSEYLNTN